MPSGKLLLALAVLCCSAIAVSRAQPSSQGISTGTPQSPSPSTQPAQTQSQQPQTSSKAPPQNGPPILPQNAPQAGFPQISPQNYFPQANNPQGPGLPSNAPQNEILYRCRQSTYATDGDVLTVLQMQLPYTSAGRCMIACSAQQLGLMHGYTIAQMAPGAPLEREGAGVLLRTLYPARGNDLLFQNDLLNAVNSCSGDVAARATQFGAPFQTFPGTQFVQTGLQQALDTFQTANTPLFGQRFA